MTYTPNYDTTIQTTTVQHLHNTLHIRTIDWDYPFDDPEHTSGMCCSEERKREEIEKLKSYLRICEKWSEAEVYVSNYGGWPRIWHRVVDVGMASCWPYWKPRPVVLVEGTLSAYEFYDWHSLTGAKIKESES